MNKNPAYLKLNLKTYDLHQQRSYPLEILSDREEFYYTFDYSSEKINPFEEDKFGFFSDHTQRLQKSMKMIPYVLNFS